MASFNKVILVGNLTRDPQVKYTPGGQPVAEIGLAVSRQWFDKQSNSKKEETTFVDITLWGRQAEVAGQYLAKGRSVLIEGRLQLDSWEDKQSGQKRSKLRVVCENMTMLGSGSGGGGGGAQSGGGFGGGQARAAGGPPAGRGAPPAQQGRGQSSFESDEFPGHSPVEDFYSDAPSGGGFSGGDDDVPF